ncbi:MAG: hypothetical protein UZ08_BCD001000417 [Candidatus Parvibacillus calidus]|nr:MAG: hypothetical protein UZ08_BCD001000417 [Candidatus Parvibacillus calidus]
MVGEGRFEKRCMSNKGNGRTLSVDLRICIDTFCTCANFKIKKGCPKEPDSLNLLIEPQFIDTTISYVVMCPESHIQILDKSGVEAVHPAMD